MTRWYTHAAGLALAAWLASTLTAQAQPGYPVPVGATRIPEPLSYTPKKPPPDVAPGPITPDVAPMGPPPELNLPANHTGAFQCENFPTEEAYYASLGTSGLDRWRLPRLQTAFHEVSNLDLSPTQFYPALPPSARPAVQDLADLHPNMQYGIKATLGYLMGNQAVEFTGFYLSPNQKEITVLGRGDLTVPFGTISTSFPLGFEGNNGLWVNADQVTTFYTFQAANAELNYRTWNTGVDNTELILGLRYFHSQETVGIFTNDERLALNAFGRNDNRRAATYTATSRNNVVAAQMGGEWSAPCPLPVLKKFLWLTAQGKAGVGPNIVERRWKLFRGDGFKGFNVSDQDIRLGQIYDLSAYFDFHLMERMRLRAGYQAIWLIGTSSAGNEVNFNLATQGLNTPDRGTQFFHGPVIELQFLF